ncbi:D-2-hydroxyacid dehydrogenase family protein [Pollutimonas bauzanensis]|uniref:Phosphoglycerate dehydrogenase n=1 Tax=Pollutimonas bauzanensis TaxID=658167 RepID=A0A1M5QBC3_9BURK|nr:D-2-hydroxyacid dehydrogenase family protein [Pollutimonas bauzanensis]SHH11332.1 Phosphoglycerate dehydrogenase [Pollutimonas bauzanensis]
MTRIAILDDWQRFARIAADWAPLESRASLQFFHSPFRDEDEAAAALAEFDIIVAMRERTPFPATLVSRLPRLQLFAFTGARGGKIDFAALLARGITIACTDGSGGEPTAELALGLMLSAVRRIPAGDAALRGGRFQEGVSPGFTLKGKTLGVIGLGRIGSLVAGYGAALGMQVLAWSRNLTPERAQAAGARFASRDELLRTSDIVTLHVVLSDETRRLIGRAEIAAMKQGAVLVNTSRSGLIDQAALLEATNAQRIIAAIDVYDTEPLDPADPIRSARNTVLTPHLGYGSVETLQTYYRQSIENVLAFLDGAPIRVISADPNARRH